MVSFPAAFLMEIQVPIVVCRADGNLRFSMIAVRVIAFSFEP